MRRLREKLHSESGASILLALLLFLVCCMVAASILAAVMSNAGKVRSNQAEQQKYLTLSSAIQFVADEIEGAAYTWKYTVYEWDVTDGSDTKKYFFCEQNEIEYTCDLDEQIPLRKWLDKEFPAKEDGYDGYERSPSAVVPALGETVETTLYVTLPGDLAGYPYPASDPDSDSLAAYKVPNKVTVEIEVEDTPHHIRLTAWLGTGSKPTDKSDTMIAELVAVGSVPLLSYINPESRAPGKRNGASGDDSILPDPYLDDGGTRIDTDSGKTVSMKTPVSSTATMKWKLNWIKKGGL